MYFFLNKISVSKYVCFIALPVVGGFTFKEKFCVLIFIASDKFDTARNRRN